MTTTMLVLAALLAVGFEVALHYAMKDPAAGVGRAAGRLRRSDYVMLGRLFRIEQQKPGGPR